MSETVKLRLLAAIISVLTTVTGLWAQALLGK